VSTRLRRLLLLRHAEAETVRPGLTDLGRPLTLQGRAQAAEAARCLQTDGPRPDAVLVSPAARARETALIIAEQLQCVDALRYEPALYPGEVDTLLPALQRCHAGAHTLLVVGHNPGLSALALRLAGSRIAPAAVQPSAWQLGTGAWCRIELQANAWRELGPGVVKRVWFA